MFDFVFDIMCDDKCVYGNEVVKILKNCVVIVNCFFEVCIWWFSCEVFKVIVECLWNECDYLGWDDYVEGEDEEGCKWINLVDKILIGVFVFGLC